MTTMNFGERINQVQQRNSWSQNELVKILGTSGTIIGRRERCEMITSVEVAKKLTDAGVILNL